ncbi:hypothetical protein, partial [Acetomicrobium sp. S15 = DSM 107314]|uniref:hypothetical protein n=1 Tax=Acetomicrobium sp. S15 = DSM 107314 TaxID=2529858 RepID=UPI001E4E8E82
AKIQTRAAPHLGTAVGGRRLGRARARELGPLDLSPVGFCDSRMHPVFADVGPIAGYATTLTVGADLPYMAAKSADRSSR